MTPSFMITTSEVTGAARRSRFWVAVDENQVGERPSAEMASST